MFRSLPAAKFGATDAANGANLAKLADAMSAPFERPKDGKEEGERGIPALYTYFGQFVDHDITFDPASDLQKQNDPDALVDYRTPAFDLDNVYGRGPSDQPYMYDGENGFLLGDPLSGGSDPRARDLPRNAPPDLPGQKKKPPRRALIGDPRNDENSIVSQLQGLFLRFHNRMLRDNPGMAFPDIQQLVRFHYQYVVLNDFLPRIVHSDVLRDLKSDGKFDKHKLEFFHWRNDPFMPVEFSVAAYRMGHSMIRPAYRLNDAVLLPVVKIPPKVARGFSEGLTGFQAMNPAWGLDWGRFIDVDVRNYDGPLAVKAKRLQFAYRIDTSLVNPLGALPPIVATKPPSLPWRNLLRGWSLGLPSGQQVARAMGIEPLTDGEIQIGKGVDAPRRPLPTIHDLNRSTGDVFRENCPLWTYILAEAMHHKEPVKIPVLEDVTVNTPKLGPVGGRIVAEVFLGLMFGDRNSMLSLWPNWHPDSGHDYTLKDFVKKALEQ